MSRAGPLYLDYREWMKDTLHERIQANPLYSLRAFARDLELSPASVSLVLNGKKGLSQKAAERIVAALDLPEREGDVFKTLVKLNHSRNESEKAVAKAKLLHWRSEEKALTLTHDIFRATSEWYHFAILQLTQLSGFQSNSKWISKKLGVSETETEQALQRLVRLGLLIQKNGRYRPHKSITLYDSSSSTIALRKYQRQIMQKAFDAIESQSLDQRFLSSSLIPIKRANFKKVIERIKKSIDEIVKNETTSEGDAEAIYAISTQFFEIAKATEDFK